MRGISCTVRTVVSFHFFLGILVFPLLLLRTASAQFDEEIFFETEEWVETAAKRLQPIEESPAAVTIITAEEIQASGATNLGEVLRRVPGLEVMSLLSCDYVIGARGQNRPLENGVLALVNGRSIYEDFFGVVLWNSKDFPLEMIERIEVVRGPGSVLYGANAFHAVVNIITKTPLEAPGSTVSLTAGSNAMIGTLMRSGRSGKLGHIISAGWTQYHGYEDRDDIIAQYPRVRAALIRDLGDLGEIRVEAGVLGGDFGVFYEQVGILKTFSVSANTMVKYERPNFYFRAFWNTIDSDRAYVPKLRFEETLVFGVPLYIEEGYELEFELENHILDFEAQKIFEFPLGNLVTVGLNYRYSTTNYTAFDVHMVKDSHPFAAYVQHEFVYLSYLHTYFGLRVDHHALTGISLSPRASVLATPLSGHTFRASVGRSFRNPTFTENYIELVVPMNLGDVGMVGDTELDPEVLTSYEFGYQAGFMKNQVKLGASVFWNQIDGLISPVFPTNYLVDAGSVIGRFSNFVDEEAWGVEVETRYRPARWMSAFANYTYTEVEDLTFDLPDERTPRHKMNLGVMAGPLFDASASVFVHYVSETAWPPIARHPDQNPNMWLLPVGGTDSYVLINARLAYRFWKEKAEAGVSVFNLLNDGHREYPLTEEIPIIVSGNIKVTF